MKKTKLKIFASILGTAALSLLLIIARADGAFAAPTLTGNWGCLTTGVFGDVADGDNFSLAQLMQFTISASKVTSGTVRYSIDGEQCLLPVTGGAYNLNTSGVGKLSIALTIPALDVDGDFPCVDAFGLAEGVTSVTETWDIVVADQQRQFGMVGADPFLSGPEISDAASDFSGVIGSGRCVKQ
jgi:hypothetical protein